MQFSITSKQLSNIIKGIDQKAPNKMKKIVVLVTSLLLLTTSNFLLAQKPKPPIMGWSSWNHFRVNIDEKMIREQADALVSSGMYDAGYRFINIDDGYFGGRDANGNLLTNKSKFPSGMKALADYIHGKGLKAGIYTDAGMNTCGSIWDKDSLGVGAGIYGHWSNDCKLFFKDWGFDFLKVDWCGGEKQHLDEATEYLKIIDTVKAINADIVFNVCRWQFPGEWAIKKADSWRISGDIRENFKSILGIIDLDAELYRYSSAGHYNDMDMLQVGQGMSYDEDKSHFSLWCMLNSPLLAGNDLRNMTKETIEILTNKEVIALNQDKGFAQAQRIIKDGNVEVWVKQLGNGKQKALAILNRGDDAKTYKLDFAKLGITARYKMRDLWLHKELGKVNESQSFTIPKHGIVVLKLY
ncbi:glycoside hydrolase family 27 protein [Chitinophagaceae bacterium 26-R-25]|nr:glycoside hydrolase family 27 protein [Chitinophagaceae bacterium 26-R-25]